MIMGPSSQALLEDSRQDQLPESLSLCQLAEQEEDQPAVEAA